jgi:hypothetical protein
MNIKKATLEKHKEFALLSLAIINALLAGNKTILIMAEEFKKLDYPARWSAFVGWISKSINYEISYEGGEVVFKEITVLPTQKIEE